MRVAAVERIGAPWLVSDVEPLPLGRTQVVVRIGAAPVCSTDISCAQGRIEIPEAALPFVAGHSSAGTVVEVGSDVRDLSVGQRVIVGGPECRECYWCVRNRPDQCVGVEHVMWPVAVLPNGREVSAFFGGAYADFVRIERTWLVPVDTDLPDEQLAMIPCGIGSAIGFVFTVARVEVGSSVAIVGCGHLGLWMIQATRLAGAREIIAVEPDEHRRTLAGELGATALVDPEQEDPVEAVRRLTGGRGADYVLEAAGPPRAQEQAFLMSRRAGVVVFAGWTTSKERVSFDQFELAILGREIRTGNAGNAHPRVDYPRIVGLLEDGRLQADRILTGRYRLDDVNEAIEASLAHRDISGVVVP